jgi:hypothetical protein
MMLGHGLWICPGSVFSRSLGPLWSLQLGWLQRWNGYDFGVFVAATDKPWQTKTIPNLFSAHIQPEQQRTLQNPLIGINSPHKPILGCTFHVGPFALRETRRLSEMLLRDWLRLCPAVKRPGELQAAL